MKTVFILRCDGRTQYIQQTIRSVREHIAHPFDRKFIIDDSADASYAAWLDDIFPDFERIHHEERRGLGGCFKSALETAAATDADYAFITEDDMPILDDINLEPWAALLDYRPYLAQVGLNRKPLNDDESREQSVVAAHPHLFTEKRVGSVVWVETDNLFVFSPSLVPQHAIDAMLGNTTVFLEREITDALLALEYRFSYWGTRNDPPLCAHAGTVRSSGYRW